MTVQSQFETVTFPRIGGDCKNKKLGHLEKLYTNTYNVGKRLSFTFRMNNIEAQNRDKITKKTYLFINCCCTVD